MATRGAGLITRPGRAGARLRRPGRVLLRMAVDVRRLREAIRLRTAEDVRRPARIRATAAITRLATSAAGRPAARLPDMAVVADDRRVAAQADIRPTVAEAAEVVDTRPTVVGVVDIHRMAAEVVDTHPMVAAEADIRPTAVGVAEIVRQAEVDPDRAHIESAPDARPVTV